MNHFSDGRLFSVLLKDRSHRKGKKERKTTGAQIKTRSWPVGHCEFSSVLSWAFFTSFTLVFGLHHLPRDISGLYINIHSPVVVCSRFDDISPANQAWWEINASIVLRYIPHNVSLAAQKHVRISRIAWITFSEGKALAALLKDGSGHGKKGNARDGCSFSSPEIKKIMNVVRLHRSVFLCYFETPSPSKADQNPQFPRLPKHTQDICDRKLVLERS